jgi:hypothetical protein
MPRFNYIKNSLLAGELSPKALGRTELPIYGQGCEILENMVVMPQGGATRRPGTKYVTNTLSNNTARLIPFIFSLDEAYIVELTDGAIRIINGSSFSVLTESSGITGANLYHYTAAQLFDIQYVQSGDDLFLVHPDVEPQVLRRTGTNTFHLGRWYEYITTVPVGSISSLQYIKSQPFMDLNPLSTTLTPAATTGSGIVLTASAAIFTANHVGAYFLLDHSGTIGACQVSEFTDTTHVKVTIMNTFGNTTATSDWFEGAWSNARGWPRSVGFFQNRIIFGGTSYQPDTFWASQQENYAVMLNIRGVNGSGFTGTASTTDPCNYTGAAQQANEFQWLSGGKTLAGGTLGSEHIIQGATNDALSATESPIVSTESTHGSAHVQAKRIGYTVVYCQRSGRKINEITFDFYSDSYVTEDISEMAEHIVRRSTAEHASVNFSTLKFNHIDYQATPHKIIWFVDSAGGLVGCTRDKNQNLKAWHYHKLGGRYRPSSTDEAPLVKSIAVIPSPNGTADRVFLSVTRYNAHSAANQNFIEYMDKEFEGNNFTDEDPIFLDCAKVATSGSPTTSWTGFTHLEGETVSLLADGFTHADVTISATGTFSTSFACSKVIVGFKNTPIVKLTRPDAGAAFGSAQGAIKRIDRAVVRFYKTATCKIGSSSSDTEEISFRTSDQAMNAEIPLFTGDKSIDLMQDWDRDCYVYITCDDPLPMTIVSVALRGGTNEA